MADPIKHAGTIDDPIPQQIIYKSATDGMIYTVAAGAGSSSSSIDDATDSMKGVAKLSDAVDGTENAATGKTAATPAAIKTVNDKVTALNTTVEDHKKRIETLESPGGSSNVVDATDKVKGISKLSDATDSDADAATGLTAATPKAVKSALEQAKAYTDAHQGQGTSADATDTVKGNNMLSDALDSDLDAATGVTAATPKAVKLLNTKLTEHGTRLDAIEAGGSGGNGMNYVLTPKILTPTTGATGQSTRITITGSGFESVVSGDTRKHREFQVSDRKDFTTTVGKQEANADSLKMSVNLKGHTKYYARIRDISNREFRSGWSAIVEFTTGDAIQANTPALTLKGYSDSPTDIGSGLTIEGSAYAINDGSSDTHKATSWSIRTSVGRSNVWESLNDTTNKTSIVVPKGTLQKDTKYIVTVIYHSTEYSDSDPATKEFTTAADFGTVQAPVITVTGQPDKVQARPTISGGVFSSTREPDTHAQTEIKVYKSAGMVEIWTTTTNTPETSVVVPKGKLEVSTQYKVKMRYKGTNYGWSAWNEKDFTTVAKFNVENFIGIPGTSTFGVGLAPESLYKSVKLEPAPKCEIETDFQYGLYVRKGTGGVGDSVAMKWIPKFYIAMLQKNEGTVNLTDTELDALLPYVDVTKEQMKEAQRRSPHNAMVVASSDKFANEIEANAKGFGLMRGFIDGGKEQDGFFIANTLTCLVDGQGAYKALALGLQDKTTSHNLFRSDTDFSSYEYQTDLFTISTAKNNKGNFISTLANTEYQCCSFYAWAVISVLSLIQGQYATSTADCAWYDSTLQKNFPKGINNYTTDNDDSTVQADRVDGSNGKVFVTQGYEKTTHNGSITGITNVNGWLYQLCVGSWGDGSKLLKRSSSIYDITYDNVDNSGASYYESKDVSRVLGEWGGDKSSFPSLTGQDKDLFGIYAFGGNSSRNSNEFGQDNHYRNSSSSAVYVGGYYNDTSDAGVFYRLSNYWTYSYSYYGARAMAYPRV